RVGGRQAGLVGTDAVAVHHLLHVGAPRGRRLLPEVRVRGVEAGPHLVEGWQDVRRIHVVRAGDELDQVVLGVEVLGPYHVENPLGLGRVGDLGGAGRVAPAVRGEDEGGREVLLALRGPTPAAPRTRGRAPPSNLAGAVRHVV